MPAMAPAVGFEPTMPTLNSKQLQSSTQLYTHPVCSELMELLHSWDSFSSPLRTAIMAIVRTAKDTTDQ
jgi:hypothetical protein